MPLLRPLALSLCIAALAAPLAAQTTKTESPADTIFEPEVAPAGNTALGDDITIIPLGHTTFLRQNGSTSLRVCTIDVESRNFVCGSDFKMP